MLGFPIFKLIQWFYQAFLQFSSAEKWRSAIYYRKTYSKCNKMNFIKMVTFSLKQALSVDVWTSYSTSSQYYFPLTAPGIWSPYVKGKCGFGWGKGWKIISKTSKIVWYTAWVLLSFEMYSFGHGFETFASTKTTLSLDVRTWYSRSC